MQKAIHIENSGKIIERILSIAEPEIIENNPTELEYILVDDFPEQPVVTDSMQVNYPMYNTQTGEVIWIQIDYQYTATNELLEIENLKTENASLKSNLQIANDNINMLTETIADMIGGAI